MCSFQRLPRKSMLFCFSIKSKLIEIESLASQIITWAFYSCKQMIWRCTYSKKKSSWEKQMFVHDIDAVLWIEHPPLHTLPVHYRMIKYWNQTSFQFVNDKIYTTPKCAPTVLSQSISATTKTTTKKMQKTTWQVAWRQKVGYKKNHGANSLWIFFSIAKHWIWKKKWRDKKKEHGIIQWKIFNHWLQTKHCQLLIMNEQQT